VVIGELDAVVLVPNGGVAVLGLLSQVGAEEQASLLTATLRTQARGLSSPLIRSQSR
jgi:hypothetical protein